MINDKVNKLLKKLDLEKITVLEKITILCYPKKNDKNFKEKFENVEKEMKKISKNIELKVIEEGEIDYVKTIDFSGESGIDGSSCS